MKLERQARQPKIKAREAVGIEIEEQPLGFDLQPIIEQIKAFQPEPPYRSDYQFLLGLAGHQYVEQLRPDYKAAAANLHEQGIHPGVSKLFNPTPFLQKGWSDDELRSKMNDYLAIVSVVPERSWMPSLEFLVLFPEERQHILKVLRPAEGKRLAWIVDDAHENPDTTMAPSELAVMKLLDPENTVVEKIARRFWGKWNNKLFKKLDKRTVLSEACAEDALWDKRLDHPKNDAALGQ